MNGDRQGELREDVVVVLGVAYYYYFNSRTPPGAFVLWSRVLGGT